MSDDKSDDESAPRATWINRPNDTINIIPGFVHKRLKWKPIKVNNDIIDDEQITRDCLSKKINLLGPFKWYKHESKYKNFPKLRAHTICDIGDHFISIGGFEDRKQHASVYKIPKNFEYCKKITCKGGQDIPCYRFYHTANYIKEINGIFILGGLNHKYNLNDAYILFLDDYYWCDLNRSIQTDEYLQVRGHHCSAMRVIQDECVEIYIFGGQYCYGGPYVYHNDLWCFTFKNTGEYNFRKIKCSGDTPSVRSQCFIDVMKDNKHILLYGGAEATTTKNDMYLFDIENKVWKSIEYQGNTKPPRNVSLTPKDYSITPIKAPIYYDNKFNKLIVIYYGFSRKDFSTTKVYCFNFDSNKWHILSDTDKKSRKNKVPKFLRLTQIVKLGNCLIQIGGNGLSRNDRDYVRQLWCLTYPTFLSWNKERLLWIGFYKNDKTKKCYFKILGKDLIGQIISFLNPSNQTFSCDI